MTWAVPELLSKLGIKIMSVFPKLRVGLVGCGPFGESHLLAFAGIPYVEVVAVTDAIEERAQKLAARYNIPRVVKGYHELCTLENVDAVSVATSESQHLDPALSALKNGKHVFVEKPIATRVEEAEEMIRAARERDRILMPGHILRFETKYATVKEQIALGRLGRVVSIYARRFRPRKLAATYKRTPLLLMNGIHDIDIMLWYVGKDVVSVRAFDVVVDSQGCSDFSCAFLRFQDGTMGVLQATWMLPDKSAGFDDYMQVVTTSGIATIDVLQSGLTLWTEDGHEVPDVSYGPALRGAAFGALREELSYFALCVLENRQPTVISAEDGLKALRVALSLLESSRQNREVEVPVGCEENDR